MNLYCCWKCDISDGACGCKLERGPSKIERANNSRSGNCALLNPARLIIHTICKFFLVPFQNICTYINICMYVCMYIANVQLNKDKIDIGYTTNTNKYMLCCISINIFALTNIILNLFEKIFRNYWFIVRDKKLHYLF